MTKKKYSRKEIHENASCSMYISDYTPVLNDNFSFQ